MPLTAIGVMAVIGCCCAAALVIAERVFHVEEDPRIDAVRWALPGANCGLCGFPGCLAAAKAVVAGKAPLDVCLTGGADTETAVARAMGQPAVGRQPRIASVQCKGGTRAPVRFIYRGAADCRAAEWLGGGPVTCDAGCLGLGTCRSVCRFDAITMDPKGFPVIDADRCRGCGRCAAVCPRGVIRLFTETEQLLGLAQKGDCLSPCTQKCPARVDVPRFVRHLRNGDPAAALRTIKARNPLPLICGRVCHHPCETICRRNIADEGVGVIWLQRYLAQWEMHSGRRLEMSCARSTGHRVAVIGGGPAGLSCAYFLRRAGHQPVIFEAFSELGGMMRYAIPAYRLPLNEVRWDIEGILRLGIEARTGTALGKDFSIRDLEHQGFGAIFVGTGAWRVPPLKIPGASAKGVISSLVFLDHRDGDIGPVAGRRVLVVGATNTAMDCARTAIRLGAACVTVACPCEERRVSARKRDVNRAAAEGVHIVYSTRVERIVDDRRVRWAICIPGVDDAAAAVSGDTVARTMVPADVIVNAMARIPDLNGLAGADGRRGVSVSPQGTIAADPITHQTGVPHVFTAGDAYTGRASVIQAVAGGRRAARSIHFYLTEGGIPVPARPLRRIDPASILKQVIVAETIPKVRVPEAPAHLRRRSFREVVVGTISSDQAQQEAARCLCCGRTCYDRC